MRNRDVTKVLGENFSTIKQIQKNSGSSITFSSDAYTRAECHTFVQFKGTNAQIDNAILSIEARVLESYMAEKHYYPWIFMPISAFTLEAEIDVNSHIRGLTSTEIATNTWIQVHATKSCNSTQRVSIFGERGTLANIMDHINSERNLVGETRKTSPEPKWVEMFGETPQIISMHQHEANVSYKKLLVKVFKAMVSILVGLFAVMTESNLLEDHKALAYTAIGVTELEFLMLAEPNGVSMFLLSASVGTQISLLV